MKTIGYEEVMQTYHCNLEYLGDFQCDLTGGYPVSLCYDLNDGIAFLYPNDLVCDEFEREYELAIKACKTFGVCRVADENDVNQILDSLGEDAKGWKI